MEKISVLKSTPLISQDYSSKDTNLITTKTFDKLFGNPNDRIEVHLYDGNQEQVESEYNYTKYTLGDNFEGDLYGDLLVDPQEFVNNAGYDYGNFNVNYYF